jgi:hemerythrin-like domain-containing protein
MFDFLTTNLALSFLKKDHDTVKDVFDKFEKAEGRPAKKKIVNQALAELKVHAAIEEELFYPAVLKPIGKDIMNEADEEHHVAKVLIPELEGMDGREDHYDAKFTVLAENVRHHIKEEENEVFPKAKDAAIDFEELSHAMGQRKETLLAKGVPPAAEDAMVAASHGKGDSPGQAAHKRKPRAAKSHAGRQAVPGA